MGDLDQQISWWLYKAVAEETRLSWAFPGLVLKFSDWVLFVNVLRKHYLVGGADYPPSIYYFVVLDACKEIFISTYQLWK